MNRMSIYIKIAFCVLVANYAAHGQTASSTAGCAELNVQFTAPQATSYYWEFGDGPSSVSTLQNPEHSYIQDGTYTAKLFDEEGGTQVGDDIIITVYPPIEININADIRSGCAPLEVNFTSSLTIDDDIEVEDIVWTFGDGNSASGESTNYTYMEDGIFTVSVKVIASESIKCDEPIIFEDYITVEGERVIFNIDKTSSCNVPEDFTFTNASDAEAGSTYFWDFGNSQTSTAEGPHTITYNTAGVYFPILTITSPSGCETSLKRTISLGAPIITPTYPDTICFGQEVTLSQSTLASDFIWDFTGTSIDTTFSPRISEEKRPTVFFTEPGLQTFTLTAIAQAGCESTETLSIFVYVPDASYSITPANTCLDPILIEYVANDPNFSTYIFNHDFLGDGVDIEREESTGANIYENPERDEYHINGQDSINTRLIVISEQGCIDTAYLKYFLQRPEAFFIPDVVKGCVPFEVNFEDLSFSENEIQIRDWDFGDGQGQVYGTNDTLISHVYTTPGIHEAVLTITDIAGCEDVSREVEIIAIDKDTIPAPPSPPCPEFSFCVDEEVNVLVGTDQVNVNMHLESDEGRFDHCWKERLATHAYQYPGQYPLDFTLEFFTVYIDSFPTGCIINIEGSRSDIDYFIDCANPYDVNLSSEESINADEFEWYVEDQLISTEESLVHTFDERGVYMVYLDTRQSGVGCTHRDSAEIHITEIRAEMSIPERSCVSEPSELNALASQDVHDKCRAGYIWEFENQRPRQVASPILSHSFLAGFQEVKLIVEDINGCTDTISSTTTAYDLQANFNADTLVCLPTDASLLNESFGDTTIVAWNWDFGGSTSNLEDPMHVFDSLDYDPELFGDSITVSLSIEDAIGCVDTDTFLIVTYDIFSDIRMDDGPTICQNESITFDAADYNLGGSFLTYEWDFGVNGTSTEDNPTVLFAEAGVQPIMLTFTEDATGCQGTLDTFINVSPTPVADFISDQDSVEFICFPEQIQFTNTSIVDTLGSFFWDFGNGDQSNIEDPKIAFDKGTYEVQLIVFTPDACVDTFSQSYTLVGPEGSFSADKENICPGEEITFTLNGTTDVSSYTWDFGDGVQVDDQSPVTHTYDIDLELDAFTPTLILRSDEDGCELIQDLPINVSSISDSIIVPTDPCPGELSLSSSFANPQTIEWDIDGQIITGTTNPSVVIESDRDSIDVILYVTDARGCVIERSRRIANRSIDVSDIQFPNVFSPNGDNINPVFNIVILNDDIIDNVEVTDFRVYNRWGELLYNNQNPSMGWDGRYLGEIVPPDVYAYYIEVTVNGCAGRSKKGNVTVIK